MKSVRSIWSFLVSRKIGGLVSVWEGNHLPKINTFESRINVLGRLLILEQNSTQDMFITTTPFFKIWNIFHPLKKKKKEFNCD